MKAAAYLTLLLVASSTWAAEPREPRQVIEELLQVYGKELKETSYIPALAVACRWRYAEFLSSQDKEIDQQRGDELRGEVVSILQPYLRGDRSAKLDSPSAVAGHLAFATLVAPAAESNLEIDTEELGRCRALILTAADSHFDAPMKVRSPGPQEMSDGAFMHGPILCEAGVLTKEPKYFRAAEEYLLALWKLRKRDDDLYAHGHLCDVAWGRGNGFPAVGLAWSLDRMPESKPLQAAFKAHIAALLKHQDADGMWHQVIDHPESGPEFSATAMIGFALQRGVRRGWLGVEHQQAVHRAWQAICRRIEPDGKLHGVCESTGTQQDLQAYLSRRLNHGVDHRGGAMALLFATERLSVRDEAAAGRAEE